MTNDRLYSLIARCDLVDFRCCAAFTRAPIYRSCLLLMRLLIIVVRPSMVVCGVVVGGVHSITFLPAVVIS